MRSTLWSSRREATKRSPCLSLRGKSPIRIHFHFPNVLWIGTNGNGIKKIIVQRHLFQTISLSDKGTQVNSSSMVEDANQNLWISTDEGIKLFSLKTSNSYLKPI